MIIMDKSSASKDEQTPLAQPFVPGMTVTPTAGPLSAPTDAPVVEVPLWQRIKSTMRVNPKLLPVKLLVFLVHGGIAALFPFFTLHMKALGISVKEMAWMLLLLPIVSSIGPPLGGALADRLGNYKLVLIIFTILSVFLHLMLWFAVPAFGTTLTALPVTINATEFHITFPCHGYGKQPVGGMVHLPPTQQTVLRNCLLAGSHWAGTELFDCTSTCPETADSGAQICFMSGDTREICYHWMDIENFEVTGVAAIPVNAKKQPAKNSTSSHPRNSQTRGDNTTLVRANTTSSWKAATFSAPGLQLHGLRGGHCRAESAGNCSVSCRTARSENHLDCQEMSSYHFGDRLTTLALYFTFRFLSFTAVRVVFPLLDAALLEITKEHNGDFGIQRLFASVGFVVIPPLSGFLIGVASRRNKFADYSPAFYLFGTMNTLAAALMIFMKISGRKKQTNIWASVGTVMKNPNVSAFAVAILISGAAFGFLVNFLFLFMETDRDFPYPAPKYLLGLTSTVGYLLGIPLLFFSTQLIRFFGLENLLAFGLLCYALRFVSYSFTFDPFLVLPIEILTAVTGMVLVLMPQFAIKTAPKYLATLVGLFGALNFGLGGGIGPLVGGLLVSSLGYRSAFRIMSGICAGVALLYFLVYHLYLKTRKPSTALETIPKSQLTNGHSEPEKEPLQNGNGHTIDGKVAYAPRLSMLEDEKGTPPISRRKL